MRNINPIGEKILEDDINYILKNTIFLWKNFKDCNIFISGGTGFFGKWIIKCLVKANDTFNLNLIIFMLTREPKCFINDEPELSKHKSIRILTGGMSNFEYPNCEINYIIHTATETNNNRIKNEPLFLFESNINGTKHILKFAKSCNAKNILITSSGAVYGNRFCEEMNNVSEMYNGAPFTTEKESVYGNGKRTIEILSALYANKYNLNVKIARCFSFVGPYLPLNENYAIGNFILDALGGRNISIKGDGTPRRSYMYMADLVIWLLNILINGKSCHPYNVGSNYGISILDLANIVSKVINPDIKIEVMKRKNVKSGIEYYVPSTDRAIQELNLKKGINLEEAIKRTADWYLPLLNTYVYQ